ncbi:MAG: hypothetical protein AAFO69_09310 [Bacteroidota bacterium]
MAIDYQSPQEVIELALKRLKKEKKVASDAAFNYSSDAGFRKEVTYKDMDFLEALGYCDEMKVVDDAMEFLLQNNLISKEDATYDKSLFLDLRMELKKKFKGDWGTITPVTERFFYMMTSVRKPKNILAVGIFWGNAVSWNIGSSCGAGKVYDAESVIGIDLNPEAIEMARKNFDQIADNEHITLLVEDGIKFAKETTQKFDYVYLDVGISQIEKSLNYPILNALYDNLEEGAWVLTHDTTHPYFNDSFEKYLAFVRDKNNFRESICFGLDQYGLELSIK